jgi:hypothetical protein
MLNYAQTFYVGTTPDQRVQARSKTSRIYLVDLAGSERTKLSGLTLLFPSEFSLGGG